MSPDTEIYLNRPPVADESREAAAEFSGFRSLSQGEQPVAVHGETQPQDLQPIETHVDDHEIFRDF